MKEKSIYQMAISRHGHDLVQVFLMEIVWKTQWLFVHAFVDGEPLQANRPHIWFASITWKRPILNGYIVEFIHKCKTVHVCER